jgi:hypothetical protein
MAVFGEKKQGHCTYKKALVARFKNFFENVIFLFCVAEE